MIPEASWQPFCVRKLCFVLWLKPTWGLGVKALEEQHGVGLPARELVGKGWISPAAPEVITSHMPSIEAI